MYDTTEFRNSERLAFWTETMCDQIAPVEIDPRGDGELTATAMRSSDFGDLHVREVVGGRHVYFRRQQEIRFGDPGTLQVGLQLFGNSILAQDGRDAVMGAGDLVLYDSSRPFTLAMDARFRWQVFLLPKDRLRRSDREISKLTAVRINGASGVAGVVGRFLRDVAAHSAELEADGSAPMLCENAVDLVGTLVQSELGQSWEVADPQRQLLEQAKAYIETHLSDPCLGPEQIAHAVNVSVRRLYQLFSVTGSAVAEYIRDERIRAVRRDLLDPRLASVPLARLAAGRGITNPSLFSRQFRFAEGMTPSAFREKMLATRTQ